MGRRLLLGILLLGVWWARPAFGLKFEALDRGGKKVLLVRDCGNWAQDEGTPCKPWEKHFAGPDDDTGYRGDNAVLDNLLSRAEGEGQPFQEIWLISGGGDLDEGIAIGRTFRRHRATVRVAKVVSDADCVSACTVAFMGGLFRYVDVGSTYQVHSGSRFQGGVSKALMEHLLGDPDAVLMELGEVFQEQQRELARQLLALFQNSLLQPLGKRVDEDDRAFADWAKRFKPPLPYAEPGDPQRKRDVQRLKSEGRSAAQDILMRIERDSMNMAIRDVTAILPELGPRAQPALNMVQAMYSSSIKETASLSQETLLKMGYVTREFDAAK